MEHSLDSLALRIKAPNLPPVREAMRAAFSAALPAYLETAKVMQTGFIISTQIPAVRAALEMSMAEEERRVWRQRMDSVRQLGASFDDCALRAGLADDALTSFMEALKRFQNQRGRMYRKQRSPFLRYGRVGR